MGNDSIYQLPAYPSLSVRKSLSPSQRATLNQTISASLLQTIALPPAKRATPAAKRFVESYAKDTALQVLQGLIWEPVSLSKDEKIIRKRVLLLAEKLASSDAGLDFQTLLDLSIIYAPSNASKMRSIVSSSLQSDPSLIQSIQNDLVPAFMQLLNYNQGLYSIRKASHCLSSFLHASPPEIIRCFAHNKPFLIHLAELYDTGLDSIATFYGRSIDVNAPDPTDEWQPIFVQTKVSLIDAFHTTINTLLTDLAAASGHQLAAESERTFDIIFALLDVRASHPHPHETTPYLDQSLLGDYQHSYSLSQTLAAALRHASEKDARLDLLESSLAALEWPSSTTTKGKDPGALKILLGSSGIAPGIDNLGNGSRVRSTASGKGKGKGKERDFPEAGADVNVPQESHVPDIDMKITQVLDILPETPAEYIRALLEHPPYNGNPENVVEALLEGTAPGPDELQSGGGELPRSVAVHVDEDVGAYVRERRNVFDDEVMDLNRMRFGKRRDREDESTVLRDRTFIEQMKADILRRAEEISDDEELSGDAEDTKPKPKGSDLAFDDADEAPAVTIGGDGESDSEGGEDAEQQPQPQNIETILELAYIRDPKVFDRDSATRREKARAELKERTGWEDEQIEGWRIMLERNPRKDKILQKHEFAGNQPWIAPAPSASGSGPRGGARGRGRGGGGGGGRGRGGGGGPGAGGGEDSTRERAWKDKNKASRGNHNRKRGHDKKMARAGAGVVPS
ncbi:CUE domain-containing protein 3 [Hypsizygus marmoreus]|uniref:CUE domain-containing protein 3 n=1 Tax=Hypsizygus marmoreus TaxID=39966 RepID=A0A369K5X7_HYPMA|nr:CUE domain-containing protein 3 [Hypsizygus marmoreus]